MNHFNEKPTLRPSETVSLNTSAFVVTKSDGRTDNFRVARLNVAAGAADASRAMLIASCRKVELLTSIFAFL